MAQGLWHSPRKRRCSPVNLGRTAGSSPRCSPKWTLFVKTRGLEAVREIQAALAEAAAWIERSGAKSYDPFLLLERAELARLTGDDTTRQHELREAHRLFVEIGATARAEQVAREIGR